MKPVNRYLWRLPLLTTFNKSWFLILLLLSTVFGFSQTTNINGIINSYHSVLGVDATKNALKLDNVSGLAYGNTVLIIQMKGATINTTASSSSFGDVTSLNYAGNYEIAAICSVSNDSVYFFNTILNSYDENYKVQLVKFGEYYSANVTDTLKAQSWNSSTGKGGVLAIKVEEDLTLNAPLFADSTGYKGGAFYLHSGSCGIFNPVGTAYAYDATSAGASNGAYKGEGVADVPSNLDGARGAPANGGGGGNNHNNGGGGGANLAAGGNGGGNFSTGPSGCNTSNLQGRGGKALSSSGDTKIFAGGGGGAGHANSTVQPYAGGNGGGIIIVLAKNIIGNGYKISANGQSGKSTTYDGASGGGAGGTIIMNVTNTYSGTLTIQAIGGNGGNEDDDNSSGRCYGAGGGGSGGAIYFNGPTPAVTASLTGGTAGINIDANSCGTPVPAVNGTAGSIIQNYSYQTSVTPSTGCTVALPIRIIYFNALLTPNKKVKIEWDIANPEEARSFTIEKINTLNNWIELSTMAAEVNLHHYEIIDHSPGFGENIYRLRINGKDNNVIYSLQKRVVLRSEDQFSVFPNPAKNKLTVTGKINPGTLIRLTDNTGRLIKEIRTNTSLPSLELLLPALSPGIYILNVDNYIKKIMIL